MKRIITTLSIIVVSSAFGQLVNSLPDTGAVTIGTHTPEAGSQLTVNGNTTLKNALGVEGDLVIEGQSILETYVRMPGIANYVGALDNFEILVTDPTGNVTKITRGELSSGLGSMPEGIDGCTPSYTDSPQWYNAPFKLFTACPDVKVGVGTITPKYLLHVEGEAYSMQVRVGNKDSESNALVSGFSVSGTQDLIELGTYPYGGAEEVKFKITNDGVMFAKEIRIRLTEDFPDYVFNEDYKLLSLKQVKEFIKQNGHLPNFPSAAEVKENGLNISEVQTKLVEKVEELTLYTIQLEEKNKMLEDKLHSLSAEMAIIKEMLTK